jgi:transposase
MKPELIVGIDVSKKTLDVCIKPAGTTFQISNDLAGFKCLRKTLNGQPTQSTLVVLEHTGLYSFRLEKFLVGHHVAYCKLPALEIKRSLGMIRGKSDRIDSTRIAQYGWLRREELNETKMPAENILKLRELLSFRAKLVKDRSSYIIRRKELKFAGNASSLEMKSHDRLINALTSEIKIVEKAIDDLIATDDQLLRTATLLQSIKGIGKIIAAYMIALTENFEKFANARKFNCYSGLAPFQHESGTSIRSRARVSHLANKEIKSLLNLAAFSAIRYNTELKEYYQRRVSEGKRKMSCINIIRSKMVARMFSIIKRQTPYQDLPLAA